VATLPAGWPVRGRDASRSDRQVIAAVGESPPCAGGGDLAVIPSDTCVVKTAISIPDDTFNEAERRAAALGVSRSEFFTTAARRYIEELDASSLTERIDAALALAGSDESSRAAMLAGRRALRDGEDW
jgi:hypothetical protein